MAGSRRPGWSTDAQEIVDRVFVYGTLRAGQPARSMIADHVVDAIPATMPGRIVAFDEGYPGFVHGGEGVVIGEVVFLTDLPAALPLLDAYEGEDFTRTLQRARARDQELWCWVYTLIDPDAARHGQPIPSGDWLDVVTAPR